MENNNKYQPTAPQTYYLTNPYSDLPPLNTPDIKTSNEPFYRRFENNRRNKSNKGKHR